MIVHGDIRAPPPLAKKCSCRTSGQCRVSNGYGLIIMSQHLSPKTLYCDRSRGGWCGCATSDLLVQPTQVGVGPSSSDGAPLHLSGGGGGGDPDGRLLGVGQMPLSMIERD
jgi:hypothetical protein